MNNELKTKILLSAAKAKIKIAGLSDDELYSLAIENSWIDSESETPEVESEGGETPVKRPKSSGKKTKAERRQELIDQLLEHDESEVTEQDVIDLIQEHAPKVAETIITVKTPVKTSETKGMAHYELATVIKMMTVGIQPLLVGPAGSGKTTAGSQVAEAMGLDYYYQPPVQQKYDILGFIDAGGNIVTTSFREWFEKGGVLMIDELDASSANAMVCVNGALDNKIFQFPGNAKPTIQHADCYLLAGANTYGLGRNRVYVGRNQLDAATLDRFATIDWNYDEAIEEYVALQVFAENGGTDTGSVKRLITKIRKIRAKVEKLGMHHIVSPRASRDGARMLAAELPESLIMSSLVFKGLSEDQQKQIGA